MENNQLFDMSADNINTNIIQYIAILGSLVLLIFVFELVRRRRIKEQYSLLWLFISIGFVVFSFWRDGLQILSTSIGISYPPAAFLLLLIMGAYMILLQFSLILSKLSEKNKILTQEIALLQFELNEIKKRQ